MTKLTQCLIVDDEPIAREIIENHLSKINGLELVSSCKNALQAFEFINNQAVDLIFLDINMPEISGLSFARSMNKHIKIIFTTAYREYAIDGFDLQAVDYLLKPISFERFLQAVNKYMDENTAVELPKNQTILPEVFDYIFVRADRKMMKINFSEIRYIESLSDYIQIHLDDKIIVTRESITNIEAKLPQNKFLRTHRSYIVSIAHIDSFTNEDIEMGKTEIPISRTYKTEVLKKLGKF